MKLKTIMCGGILLFAVLVCGCTTTPQESNAITETPNLVGTWTGTMTSYEYGDGYTTFDGAIMTLSVTEQQDRIFSGEISYKDKNREDLWEINACAGVIRRDNKTITMIEEDGARSFASLITPNEMELVYMYGGDPFCVSIDTLTRK